MKHHPGLNTCRRLLVGLTTLAAVASVPITAAAVEPAIPDGAQLSSWYDNGQDGRYVLEVLRGPSRAATGAVEGIVQSDANCAPDAQGLSHCHNVIDMSNGSRLLVRNTHLMMLHRCLAPGDRISLRALNENWVVGTLATP